MIPRGCRFKILNKVIVIICIIRKELRMWLCDLLTLNNLIKFDRNKLTKICKDTNANQCLFDRKIFGKIMIVKIHVNLIENH